MSKKKHMPGKIPPANQPQGGPGAPELPDQEQGGDQDDRGASFTQQDPKRRFGHFETAGEHSMQEPGTRHQTRRDV